MTDREKAISILSEIRSGYSCFDSERPYYHALSEGIKALSQPERKPGRWIAHKNYPGLAYLCSECRYFTTVTHNYCPNCGADMREVENEQAD